MPNVCQFLKFRIKYIFEFYSHTYLIIQRLLFKSKDTVHFHVQLKAIMLHSPYFIAGLVLCDISVFSSMTDQYVLSIERYSMGLMH